MYGSWLLYSLEQSAEDGKVSQLTHNSHKGISTIIHYHQELSFSHKFNYFVRNILFNTREISCKSPDDKSKSSQRFCLLLTTSVTYLQSVKSQNMILSSSPRSNKSIIILFSRFFWIIGPTDLTIERATAVL